MIILTSSLLAMIVTSLWHGVSKSAVCVLPEVSDDLKDFVLCSVAPSNPTSAVRTGIPLGVPLQSMTKHNTLT